MFLTDLNQRLMMELQNVMERDEKIKQQLANSEYIGDFLNETRQNIDNALNQLEMNLSRPSKGNN